MKKQVMLLILLVMTGLIVSCNLGNHNGDKSIVITRVNYDTLSLARFVSVLTLEHNKIYFAPIESLTFNRKSPTKMRLISDEEITQVCDSISIATLERLKNNGNCGCDSTKYQYSIHLTENGVKKTYEFSEIMNCDSQSPCSLLEGLRNTFIKLDQEL